MNTDEYYARKNVRQLASWARYSTVHGVPHLIRGNVTRKVLWIGIITCAAIILAYSITRRFTDYFRYETLTNFKQIHDTSGGLLFPAVTLCSYNRFYYNEHSLKNKLNDG